MIDYKMIKKETPPEIDGWESYPQGTLFKSKSSSSLFLKTQIGAVRLSHRGKLCGEYYQDDHLVWSIPDPIKLGNVDFSEVE